MKKTVKSAPDRTRRPPALLPVHEARHGALQVLRAAVETDARERPRGSGARPC